MDVLQILFVQEVMSIFTYQLSNTPRHAGPAQIVYSLHMTKKSVTEGDIQNAPDVSFNFLTFNYLQNIHVYKLCVSCLDFQKKN